MWTPSAASKTQYEIVVLDILDSAASTFIDNAIIVQTGGNAAAYQDG
jgi:hypothetical protein